MSADPEAARRFATYAASRPTEHDRLKAFWTRWFRTETPHMTKPTAHHGDIDETTHPNNPANTYSPDPWSGVRGTPLPPPCGRYQRSCDDQGRSVLTEAHKLVHGDRQASYGHPANDFSRTAALANILLAGKLKNDLGPDDVALFMMCVKLSREVNLHSRDNLVDLCGYAETLNMVLNYFEDASQTPKVAP